MMYKILSVFSLSCLLLAASCRKGGDDGTDVPGPGTEDPFAFKIEGLHDTTVERIAEVNLPLSLKLLAGKTETVRLGATDLPQGMTATFSQRSGQPPFITVLTLKTNKTLEGTYPIYVTDTGRFNTVSLHKMVVKVIPYSNDALAFNGQYNESHNCSKTGSSVFPVFIQPVDKFPNRINIKGFWTKSWSTIIYADLNPDNKTINVPSQVVDNITFQGIGTYNDNEIVVNYTVADDAGLVSESCTATFSK